jgi:hypothetical protein
VVNQHAQSEDFFPEGAGGPNSKNVLTGLRLNRSVLFMQIVLKLRVFCIWRKMTPCIKITLVCCICTFYQFLVFRGGDAWLASPPFPM